MLTRDADAWRLSSNAEHCTILHTASGEDPVTVGLRTTFTLTGFQLLMRDPSWQRDPVRERQPVEVILQPSGEVHRGTGFADREVGGENWVLQVEGIGSRFLERLAESAAVEARMSGRAFARAAFPMPGETARRLSSCQRDLLTRWGVDLRALERVRQWPRPIGDPRNWVSFRDYPSVAAQGNESGMTVARLRIGLRGRPVECAVVRSSGHELLDLQTCQLLMTRAEYEPAIGEDGAPMPFDLLHRMMWIAP